MFLGGLVLLLVKRIVVMLLVLVMFRFDDVERVCVFVFCMVLSVRLF